MELTQPLQKLSFTARSATSPHHADKYIAHRSRGQRSQRADRSHVAYDARADSSQSERSHRNQCCRAPRPAAFAPRLAELRQLLASCDTLL